ncbi:MAG TPA: PEP-CTERM sorting domain-containing protein, partial [Phycisphaerae bacterium]|nr:PEP-CTERM sorting domain-containing protein [Phycisphaerae bacterium]
LVLKGVEDFEESILPPASYDTFDDPLLPGVPNLPDGFPFPKGMTGLDNIKVQSNTLGGQPSQESPRGPNALVASTAHFFYSEVVLCNWFIDSWDIVFLTQDNDTAVGANTISALGAGRVEIRVYDKKNQFVGMNTFPADPSANYFFGVLSDDPIGRINVFDLGDGAEGLDNIQAWIPEPATLPLLSLGALSLAARRRCRR